MFNRISVWLDEQAPHAGAFARATDWAARLHVPLHGVAAPVPRGTADPLSPRALQACDAACARRGVSWDTEYLIGASTAGRFFRPAELSAFSASLPADVQQGLLRDSQANPRSAVMVCANASAPAGSRILVVHADAGSRFLERVAELCRHLAAPPVVLSVARSERLAAERESVARAVFRDHAPGADFDLLAGYRDRSAIARAARARHCSTVIVHHEPAPSWWQRLRGDTPWQRLGLAHNLTLISLPGDDAGDVTPDQPADRPPAPSEDPRRCG